MDSYLLATADLDTYLLGSPQPSVSQISRVTLGVMNSRDPYAVDWALDAGGALYYETLQLLGLAPADRDGTSPLHPTDMAIQAAETAQVVTPCRATRLKS
jgi:hypothetical protein